MIYYMAFLFVFWGFCVCVRSASQVFMLNKLKVTKSPSESERFQFPVKWKSILSLAVFS